MSEKLGENSQKRNDAINLQKMHLWARHSTKKNWAEITLH